MTKVYILLIELEAHDTVTEIFKDLFDAVIFANEQAEMMSSGVPENLNVYTGCLNGALRELGYLHYMEINTDDENDGAIITVRERELR